MRIVVAVSGGFDPVHIGHVRMFKEARQLGDHLVVILNNDNWLKKKKGYAFMPESERKEILESIGHVDEVIISSHPENPDDMSVAEELELLKPHVFAQGGDRKPDDVDIPPREYVVAEKHNFKIEFNVGGDKARSSSDTVRAAARNVSPE